jgi:hypothetical protein
MRILKDLAVAGPLLVLLLLLSDAFLGPAAIDGQQLRGGRAWSWIGADDVPDARWLVQDSIVTGPSWRGEYPAPVARWAAISAAARVKDAFAQFVPGENGRTG